MNKKSRSRYDMLTGNDPLPPGDSSGIVNNRPTLTQEMELLMRAHDEMAEKYEDGDEQFRQRLNYLFAAGQIGQKAFDAVCSLYGYKYQTDPRRTDELVDDDDDLEDPAEMDRQEEEEFFNSLGSSCGTGSTRKDSCGPMGWSGRREGSC